MSMPYDELKGAIPSPVVTAVPTSSERNLKDLERFIRHAQELLTPQPNSDSLRAWMDLAEAWRITQVLGECNGNRSAAARKLGIGRRTLYAKMDKLGITPSWNF